MPINYNPFESLFGFKSTNFTVDEQGNLVAESVTSQLIAGNLNGNVIGSLTGNVTGSLTGDVTGTLQGSVIADDSSVIIDGVNKTITADSITANLTGNVVGNLTGNVTGDLIGVVYGSLYTDDFSSIIVDGSNGSITATSITGPLTGNVNGNIVKSDNFTISIDKGDSSEYVWNFYESGTLRLASGAIDYLLFPDGAKFTSNMGDTQLEANGSFKLYNSTSSDYFSFTPTGEFQITNTLQLVTNGDATIENIFNNYSLKLKTNDGIGGKIWEFKSTGELEFPGGATIRTDDSSFLEFVCPVEFNTNTIFDYNITVGNNVNADIVNDSKGELRAIPQNSKSISYQLIASDHGKHISTTAGITVPADVFTVGQNVTIFNNSSSSITITATAVTMYQAGTANTGSRTLAQRGIATILCVGTNTFVINGGGVS